MKLIISHNKPDFDALASLALARLAHPGAVAAVLGSTEEQVEAFLHLYRDQLELKIATDIPLEEVSELIVVDTSDPRRIAPFDSLIGKVPVTLYDHHRRASPAIPAVKGLHRLVGATATILTLLLKTKNIVITPELASLALLGIHEDTGNLSYAITQAEDYEAAAHLLRCGASLSLVQEFSHEYYGSQHRILFNLLMSSATEVDIQGHRVVVASFQSDDYVQGIAPLCNQILDLHGADAALVGAEMGGKTLLIARAREGSIDVGTALAEAFSGGGHPGAAFARTELKLEQAISLALAAFERHSRKALSAQALMSRPVKTVLDTASIAEAQDLLVRYGHNGLPVVDKSGSLVGVISRRDLDRALRHGLGRSQVSGFMTKNVITATEQSSQRELEQIVQRYNIGRIPIMRGKKLLGIVTRTDLVSARHQTDKLALTVEEKAVKKVLESLPSGALETVRKTQTLLKDGALHLVGGTVRDALLGTGMQDLDIVVEGTSAEVLGTAMQKAFGGSLSCHLDFGTCTLRLASGLVIDLATAREEYYQHPGALPNVIPSTLRKDLSRRDYTINALAIRVSPEPAQLLDPYGGLNDLNNRVLRSLHPLSFIEDPTRIIRGARLGGRLGLSFHPDTLAHMKTALNPEVLGKISKSRLRSELQLTCAEPRVSPALKLLDSCGALKAMFDMQADEIMLKQLDAQRREHPIPDESYLLVLLLSVPDKHLLRHSNMFSWPKRFLEARKFLLRARQADRVDEDSLADSSEAVRAVLKTLSPVLRSQVEHFELVPQRRKLRGRDVLDLGLSPGPQVGQVLAKVAKARADGQTTSFEAELKLAKALIKKLALQANTHQE